MWYMFLHGLYIQLVINRISDPDMVGMKSNVLFRHRQEALGLGC